MKIRAKEAPPINLHSKKYIRILQMFETQLKRNKKTFLSSIPPGHDHVILLHLHTSLLPIVPQTPNQLPSTLNMV